MAVRPTFRHGQLHWNLRFRQIKVGTRRGLRTKQVRPVSTERHQALSTRVRQRLQARVAQPASPSVRTDPCSRITARSVDLESPVYLLLDQSNAVPFRLMAEAPPIRPHHTSGARPESTVASGDRAARWHNQDLGQRQQPLFGRPRACPRAAFFFRQHGSGRIGHGQRSTELVRPSRCRKAIVRFSSTVSLEKMARPSGTLAAPCLAILWAGQRVTSAPATLMDPTLVGNSPEAARVTVRLPAPLEPRRATTPPAGTRKLHRKELDKVRKPH